MIVTNTLIQISYFVADIAGAVGAYDRLRWHRSRTGRDGLYEPATAAVAAPATLVAEAQSPHQVNGRALRLRVNGNTVLEITFSDPDPVTTAQVVDEINGATALVVASEDEGRLRLTSASLGSGASIEILPSAAAPFLGFDTGDAAIGLDADVALVPGTHEYFYNDQNSGATFWYRVEFRNTGSGNTTGLGVPFPALVADAIPRSQTIVGFVRLADLSGQAVVGRKITFYNAGMPNVVSSNGYGSWGIARQFAQVATDRDGYAEYRFVRGITVDVNIEGGFTRRIMIPTEGSAFDLLDPALVLEDEFGIQAPNIPFAVRTS
jgi:hypothetical protein